MIKILQFIFASFFLIGFISIILYLITVYINSNYDSHYISYSKRKKQEKKNFNNEQYTPQIQYIKDNNNKKKYYNCLNDPNCLLDELKYTNINNYDKYQKKYNKEYNKCLNNPNCSLSELNHIKNNNKINSYNYIQLSLQFIYDNNLQMFVFILIISILSPILYLLFNYIYINTRSKYIYED